MPAAHYNLAIETSGRVGSVAIGRGDEILAALLLPPQTGGAGSGGSSELMAQLDALCKEKHISPATFAEVYLSIGPGSFTGLRIGVTIAKMFAMTIGTRTVTVPTLDVVAQNAPPSQGGVAVCLNLKKETVYSGLFTWRDGRWRGVDQPSLRGMSEILAAPMRPLTIVGDPLPAFTPVRGEALALPPGFARARAEALYVLGREKAAAGAFIDPLELAPLYVRPPEAVELWDKLHGPPAASATSR